MDVVPRKLDRFDPTLSQSVEDALSVESSSRRALVVDGVEQHTGGLADLAGDTTNSGFTTVRRRR